MITIASYGAGTNSTAMLIKWITLGLPLDLILFADTGGEKPHTYSYIKRFNQWLLDNGGPKITIVVKGGKSETLEESCLRLKVLPSKVYGSSTCSSKFKIEPQDKYCNNYPLIRDEWNAGRKITKLIGFDYDESHRAQKVPVSDTKYDTRFPLIEWEMGREECLQTIKDAGLCSPGKSACFFCPSSKKSEIKQLQVTYPELFERAVAMEDNAKLNLDVIKGLGRHWSWRDVVKTSDMFGDEFFTTPEMSCACSDGQ